MAIYVYQSNCRTQCNGDYFNGNFYKQTTNLYCKIHNKQQINKQQKETRLVMTILQNADKER